MNAHDTKYYTYECTKYNNMLRETTPTNSNNAKRRRRTTNANQISLSPRKSQPVHWELC